MSFAVPLALLLLAPLGGLLYLVRTQGAGGFSRLPRAWHRVVVPSLREYLAQRSKLGRAGIPAVCFVVAALVILALARPGVDADDTDAYATLAGRVIILDVGSDLARHRHFMETLHRAGTGIATAVIASSGDAYRIVPFTTDRAQIDRYVQVLDAQMMPDPGHNPHLALALAERMLSEAGYAARQIVLLTARSAPPHTVEIPSGTSRRALVPLTAADLWPEWAQAQGATVIEADGAAALTEALGSDARAIARSELPSARHEFTTVLICLASLLWLTLFRRRTS